MARAFRLPALIALILLAPVQATARDLLERVFDFTNETLVRPLETIDRDPVGPPPFRVGLMLPRDGVLGEAAARLERGWRIAVALSDGHVADRPVEIVHGDTSDGPEGAVLSARRIMETAPVEVFAGVIGARTAAALAAYTSEAGRPLILAGAIGEEVLTGRCRPHVARTSFNVGPYQRASARFLASKYAKIATLAPASDVAYGVMRSFTEAYRSAGGRVLEQVWAPSAQRPDWSNLLVRMAQRGPDAIYAFYQGRNAERIVHAHSRGGLKRRVALVGPEWLFGPRALVRRAKHADGVRFLTSHLPTRDTPANKIFVDAYRDAHGEDPDIYAYMGYENALAVMLTAAELRGAGSDAAAFVRTMTRLDYTGLMPRGPFAFDAVNSAVLTRLFWVEIRYDGDEARMAELAMIPVKPDEVACDGPSG